jgi:integrase/recombinase XerD
MPPALTTADLAVLGYLARYTGATHDGYARHLGTWIEWCVQHRVDPIADVTRVHVELYIRELLEHGLRPSTVGSMLSPVRGFYRFAHIDGLIDRDPAAYARLPKVHVVPKPPIPHNDLMLFLAAAKDISPRHWALSQLLGVMALRISEACSLDIASFAAIEQGYPVLTFVRKGGRTVTLPLPYPVMRALEAAKGDRTEGPIIARRDGTRISRHGATGLVRTMNRHAGLGRYFNPHLLRAAAITTGLDAGIPVREMAAFAGHVDLSSMEHYDLNRANLHRNAAHTVAARLAV